MKYLKALGLAAIAAMALTAFLGASSASATVLCTTTSNPCGTGWHIDHIHATLVSGSTVSINATGGALEATCTESTVTVEKKQTGSATTTPSVTAAASNVTWGKCSSTTDTLEGGGLEIHQIAGTHNGTITASRFHFTFVIGGISCGFSFGSTDAGTLTGGSPAILDITATLFKEGGSFLCPADSVMKASYQITNHTSAYAVAG